MQCHILHGCFDPLSSVALTTPDNTCFMLTLNYFDFSLNYFRLLFLYFILFIFNSNCFCYSMLCLHFCLLHVFELHSAKERHGFLHFFECLFPRRSEPGSRPHSWHSTKLGEGPQDPDSMMQVTQGGVGPPWHQNYHSRSVQLAHKHTCSLVLLIFSV